MKSSALQTIENELPRLSHQEQLWPIEHLAQQMRKEKRRPTRPGGDPKNQRRIFHR
jgi:hypothetical protein